MNDFLTGLAISFDIIDFYSYSIIESENILLILTLIPRKKNKPFGCKIFIIKL